MTADMLYRHMLSMQCRYLKKDMVDSRMKYQETGDSAIRNQVKGTQNTFLHSVKASLFRGFQREATFQFPNWWASIPMPVASFLEEYDFKGKTIMPFCSHGGGRFGQSLTAVAKLAPDADIGEGLAINYSGGTSMPSDVSAWLETNHVDKK